MGNFNNAELHPQITLGVVSFLNSRPLVEGLDAQSGVSLCYAVPSALPAMLRSGEVDAALIPVIDLARGAGRWRRISDSCISSDGATMTVRVFSRVPPDEMSILYVDEDSHTSVALARLIWSRYYERHLHIRPLSSAEGLDACDSVLLIGDKVVTAPMHDFEFEVDLGAAWKEWTGLPFVFAVWAAPLELAAAQRAAGFSPRGPSNADHPESPWHHLADLLNAARDRGVAARAAQIAREAAPGRGWPIELAEEYLTQRLKFKITPPAAEGMKRFLDLAAEEGIVTEVSALVQ